ncbi:MAG: RIP metalloprotease RseP [Pelistega sp.]|nr:RIP metalloprotease RseP [Pelistega sp.]
MFSLLTFLITISIVVVFHEYGHYLAARYYGVHVERFSVGFGKVLYQRTDKKGTEWAISMLPLGGYVKPLAEPRPHHPDYRVGESVAERSSWEKIVIYAAGPAFSFLLGILIYTAVLMIGERHPDAIIATPAPQSVAARAGLVEGDRIVAVNQSTVASWSEAVDKLTGPLTLGQTTTLTIERPSGAVEGVVLAFESFNGSLENVNLLKEAGLVLQAPDPVVNRVIEGGPAERAGLKVGDAVVAINGQAVEQLPALIEQIQQSPNQEITLDVMRDGATLSLAMTPEQVTLDNGRTVGRIQTEFQAAYPMTHTRYGPIDAFIKANEKTWETAWFSLKMMGKMLIGEASLKNISGPLTIADYSGRVAQHGLMNFVQFIALISISIGVLNLLPIPGLDGGQMVINFVELVRGKPLPDALLMGVMKVGYGLLLLLMVFAFSNDLLRIFT